MNATGTPTLAVVDDHEDISAFVVAVATRTGYAAHAVTDTAAWLDSDAPDPDVIVLDLMMPGLDGIEVLRKFAERKRHSRFILSSAHPARVLEASARYANALGLQVVANLPKPVTVERLRELLEQQIQTKNRQPVAACATDACAVTLDDLRQAIESNQFLIHLQPQVALLDGRFMGAEALVRWQHPRYGLLYPDRFIALAECNDLAMPLTRCVIERALPQAVKLANSGISGSLSVNLPPVALTDVRFPEELQAQLRRHNAQEVELVCELTETSLTVNPTALLDILTRLRLKGFALSIDDFGTGHSSLAMLHHMPFSELKIDLQFVRAAQTDATARVIVEKSIAMARALGMKVVAEGVENLALWHWLRDCGCDSAQGYFVGKPMGVDDLMTWYRDWAAPT